MSKTKKTKFDYKNIIQNSTEDFAKFEDGTLQTLEYKGNQLIKFHLVGVGGSKNGLTMTTKNFLRLINEIEFRGGLNALKDAIFEVFKAEQKSAKAINPETGKPIINKPMKEVTELKKEFEELKGLIKKLTA
tara:strand:- start:65 stop:460 length:396 start_codon:yes stop_codon:yes gene_type:complete